MRHISWDELAADCRQLVTQIKNTDHHYDLVIGLLRGGCVPATLISHDLDVPMMAIGIRTYDDQHKTDKVDAYQSSYGDIFNLKQRTSIEKVLVVDDLSDSGDTFNYISKMYAGVFNTIHTAAPYIKTGTNHVPTYYTHECISGEWLEFPWENTP